jgi:hypothetical protein
MSMAIALYALSPTQAKKFRSALARAARPAPAPKPLPQGLADDDWGAVLEPSTGPEPQDLLDASKHTLDLDWRAFGLSFLLQRSAGLPHPEDQLIAAVFGEQLSGDRPLLRSPEELGATRAFLEGLTVEQLRAAWDPDAMTAAVYPTSAWREADALATLLAAFEELRSFHRLAVERGWWAVVELSI